MKCFTITTMGAKPGIRVGEDKMIHLGEEGRGRRLTKVPPMEPTKIEETETESRIMEMGPDVPVITLRIPDMSGYRGSWGLFRADTPEFEVFRNLLLANPEENRNGWDEYSNPEINAAYKAAKSVRPKTIAEGLCAQGDAGRMGGGLDILLLAKPGEKLGIIRHGRLYGDPAFLVAEIISPDEIRVYDFDAEITTQRAARKMNTAIADALRELGF